MHFILLSLLTVMSLHCPVSRDATRSQDHLGGVRLAYTLNLGPGAMHVSLDYTPVIPDSTVFKYGNFFYGGMKDLMKGLRNVSSEARFRVDPAAGSITFYHPGNTKFRITYDIIDTHRLEQRVVGEMFRPIITSSYFFSLSHTLFLNPVIRETMKDSILMSVKLEKGCTYPVFFTCAPELKPGEVADIILSDGMDALVTGASDLHIEKRELSGIMNYIVLRINRNNGYNLRRFMDFTDTFLPAMDDFWGVPVGSFYSLIASPFLDIKYHKISGTAFRGGFHVKYSGDTILADEEVVYTISHEIMHRYTGAGCVSMGEENQWFDEGFTDYTTWYLASECGVMPPEKLGEKVREAFRDLSANPAKNTPNEEVMKHFWEGKNYEKLPYCRGALFAAWMDKRISDLSNGTRSYRDFMRTLRAIAEKKNQRLSVNDFISAASGFIPDDEIRGAVDRYIMKGEMIPESLIF